VVDQGLLAGPPGRLTRIEPGGHLLGVGAEADDEGLVGTGGLDHAAQVCRGFQRRDD